MANKKLRRTGMLPELCDRLDRHQIETCQDFLSLGPLELMREAGQSYQQVQTLLRTVSLACAPTMVTALELRDRRSHAFFPTSLRGLDAVLHGGLASGTLTEVKEGLRLLLSLIQTHRPDRLGGLEEEIISKKAGLVIIDSIASVVRKEFDTSIPGNLSERSSLLSQEAPWSSPSHAINNQDYKSEIISQISLIVPTIPDLLQMCDVHMNVHTDSQAHAIS
ncbi:UNVERIFIED_CONTAM: hypothetical protein FKN15_052218 [Acipenser sinensis]